MKVLLTPRHHEAYGQDFLVKGMVESCGLTRLIPNDESQYELPDNVELVVSQNLDEEVDAEFIENLSDEIPVVAHLHCQWGFFNDNQKSHIKRAMEKVTICIIPARFMIQDLKHVFPEMRWAVVQNGVDINRFYPEAEKNRLAFKNTLGIRSGEFLVGYVGRLEDSKGLQLLEHVASRLHHINSHLLIQYLNTVNNRTTKGYKAHAERIKSINPELVHIIADDNPLTDRPVKYFDLLLHPSLSEVNPLVVLEALVSGVPVLATMCTPFYNDFSSLGIPSECILFSRLPERIKQDVLERSELKLTESEAYSVGEDLISILRDRVEGLHCDRSVLHEKGLAAGFSSQSMFDGFTKIYTQAVNGSIP